MGDVRWFPKELFGYNSWKTCYRVLGGLVCAAEVVKAAEKESWFSFRMSSR